MPYKGFFYPEVAYTSYDALGSYRVNRLYIRNVGNNAHIHMMQKHKNKINVNNEWIFRKHGAHCWKKMHALKESLFFLRCLALSHEETNKILVCVCM
jgi:hypothetical protein